MTRSLLPMALTLALSPLLLAPATEGGESTLPTDQNLHYRWHLGKFLGVLAGLFLPNEGDGILAYSSTERGTLITELTVTSEHSDEGEYWRYGSEIDPATGRTVRAWSSYRWRGKEKADEQVIEEEDVLSVASAIYLLRRDPPQKPRRMEIWSDGKTYPVVVIPLPEEQRRLHGREVAVRHLSIRGVRMEGRRHWKGEMDLFLARDGAATPVEIVIERSLAALHLELKAR